MGRLFLYGSTNAAKKTGMEKILVGNNFYERKFIIVLKKIFFNNRIFSPYTKKKL